MNCWSSAGFDELELWTMSPCTAFSCQSLFAPPPFRWDTSKHIMESNSQATQIPPPHSCWPVYQVKLLRGYIHQIFIQHPTIMIHKRHSVIRPHLPAAWRIRIQIQHYHSCQNSFFTCQHHWSVHSNYHTQIQYQHVTNVQLQSSATNQTQQHFLWELLKISPLSLLTKCQPEQAVFLCLSMVNQSCSHQSIHNV